MQFQQDASRRVAVVKCAAGWLAAVVLTACGHHTVAVVPHVAEDMVLIPGGDFIAGSSPSERDAAYQASLETSGNDGARRNRWFDVEAPPHHMTLATFSIDRRSVTQAQFAVFVRAQHMRGPFIDRAAWLAQGFRQNYEREVARFNWHTQQPPADRADHPVVLVTWAEADAYCRWRGARLPTAAEFEKAARGVDGRAYPWGDPFDPDRLNSAVHGPSDTVPVGSFPDGASPYGVLDLAGNIFHWTSTPWPARANHFTVKGSAWDDFAGIGRAAALHGRLRTARHVLVGFRCVRS